MNYQLHAINLAATHVDLCYITHFFTIKFLDILTQTIIYFGCGLFSVVCYILSFETFKSLRTLQSNIFQVSMTIFFPLFKQCTNYITRFLFIKDSDYKFLKI